MTQNNDNIQNVDFASAISERYLSYALSTIMSRSLPDVRDGLKPVHRRLLYAMRQLKLDPESGYKKCARVVGDVIGKYHPHGDVAVYDTLVRLAQNFSLRYPLIDGQGNFGSIDGDNAAAMRYTESKLTPIATLLMQDLDKNTVNFRPTYDNSDHEPEIMPAMFPNLLINGSEGIAVGMATSIPPHNLHELCEALIYMIDNPGASAVDELMQFIKGPDFPTGGIIIDSREGIIEAYKTGRGSFRIRAKWEQEELPRGLYQIVVTEIPYQIQKSKLIERIAELLRDKKLPLIGNIRDESTEEIRIVIEPKAKHCPADAIMESLFRQTDLETRIYLNMNVIATDQTPRVMNILEILKEFLSYRQLIVTKRTEFEVSKIENRLQILAALKVAYLNIDEVIRIIREDDEPKQIMMSKFNISDIQAEAILNIKLRALRKLEETEINREHAELTKQHQAYSEILNNQDKLWQVIRGEIQDLQQKFGLHTELGNRRTSFQEIAGTAKVVDITAFIEREPITVVCSKMGWIRALKGHNIDPQTIKYKEGDAEQFKLETYTTDKIIICASNGKFFTLLADSITKGKGDGESIKLMIEIENHAIISIFPYKSGEKMLIASTAGKGFVVNADDLLASTRGGKQIMNVSGDYKCVTCSPLASNDDMIAIIGTNRKLLVFETREIPEMKRGQGVVLQKYREASVSDIKPFNSAEGLVWFSGKTKKVEPEIMSWRARRGSVGKIPPVGFAKNGRFG